jgi:hypothetical protein
MMPHERELRAAAERLVDAAVLFNRAAGDVLAHSARRLKGEAWRGGAVGMGFAGGRPKWWS